jgi:hypothetical protein
MAAIMRTERISARALVLMALLLAAVPPLVNVILFLASRGG